MVSLIALELSSSARVWASCACTLWSKMDDSREGCFCRSSKSLCRAAAHSSRAATLRSGSKSGRTIATTKVTIPITMSTAKTSSGHHVSACPDEAVALAATQVTVIVAADANRSAPAPAQAARRHSIPTRIGTSRNPLGRLLTNRCYRSTRHGSARRGLEWTS
jgi:hypothetical protein